MMRKSSFLILISLVLVLSLVIQVGWPVLAGNNIPTSLLKWGVLLQSNHAFYAVGDTARVTHAVYNFTSTDVDVFVGTFGGNGCSYRVEILDSQNQVVWEPTQPFCLAAPSAPVTIVKNGGRISNRETIPLFFDNNQGNGVNGVALPAGFYTIRYTALFSGPHPVGGPYLGGTNPTAEVPIQIQ